MSLRSFDNMEQLGSHWTDFCEIWYLNIFRKSVYKIRVSLKSDKNKVTLHEKLHAFLLYLVHILTEWQMFETQVVEKIKKHIFLFSNVFFIKIVPFVR
jgi:hypothetical protein